LDPDFTVGELLLRERPNEAVELLAHPRDVPSMYLMILPYSHPAFEKFKRPLDGPFAEQDATELSYFYGDARNRWSIFFDQRFQLAHFYANEFEWVSSDGLLGPLKRLLHGRLPESVKKSLTSDVVCQAYQLEF
jgi:hypothetical protein